MRIGRRVTARLADPSLRDFTLWATVVVAWSALEYIGLEHKDKGGWVTFTDLVLHLRGNRKLPPYWMLLGFWLWLGYHFFMDHNAR